MVNAATVHAEQTLRCARSQSRAARRGASTADVRAGSRAVQVDEITGSGHPELREQRSPDAARRRATRSSSIRVGIGSLACRKGRRGADATPRSGVLRAISRSTAGAATSPANSPTDATRPFAWHQPGECDAVRHFAKSFRTNPPNPWPCVEVKPGTVSNAVQKAMKAPHHGRQQLLHSPARQPLGRLPEFPAGRQPHRPALPDGVRLRPREAARRRCRSQASPFLHHGLDRPGRRRTTRAAATTPRADRHRGRLPRRPLHQVRRAANTAGDNAPRTVKPTDLSPCTAVLHDNRENTAWKHTHKRSARTEGSGASPGPRRGAITIARGRRGARRDRPAGVHLAVQEQRAGRDGRAQRSSPTG